MFNRLHIEKLERELEQTKRDALPQIVEKTNDTKDETTYVNKTTGTVRVDLKGGEPVRFQEGPRYEDRTVYMPETVAPEVGKIVKDDAQKRDIELKHSGTRRTDFK